MAPTSVILLDPLYSWVVIIEGATGRHDTPGPDASMTVLVYVIMRLTDYIAVVQTIILPVTLASTATTVNGRAYIC